MKTINAATIALALFVLSACQKQTIGTGNEVKSLDFYNKNADIAKAVAEKCLEFERTALSTLLGNAQRQWHDSLDGVNCQNAKTARSFQIIAERQEKLLESDAALR